MRFRVLGPITVEGDDGGARPLPPSARAVLAMLLVARRPVPPDRLADWLWASEPPPGWSNALQAHVKTLRRTLEPDARRASRGWSRIVLDGDGYGLRCTAGEIDADELERLLQVGRAAAARADARRAADAYRAALQLWRGPAFAEFADRP